MKTHHENGLPSILPARSREHREPFTLCNWTPHEERTTSRGDFTPPQTSAPLCSRLLSWQGRSREEHRAESHAQSLPRLRLRPDGLSPVAPGNEQLWSSISSQSSLNHDTIKWRRKVCYSFFAFNSWQVGFWSSNGLFLFCLFFLFHLWLGRRQILPWTVSSSSEFRMLPQISGDVAVWVAENLVTLTLLPVSKNWH